MKALIIKIRDAGVFKAPRISGSLDKVMDIDGHKSRFNNKKKTYTPYLNVPAGSVSYKHVANLLRVLWGERPVPTLRKVHDSFKADPYFDEIAKRVRVQIETVVFPADKWKGHEKRYYPEETTTVIKSMGNSWQTATQSYLLDGSYVQVTGGLLYPDRLRRYLGDTLYADFVALVAQYGKTATTQKDIELLNTHKTDAQVIAFCAACKSQSRTSISNIILNENAKSITMHYFSKEYPLNCLMARGDIQVIEKFSATLYVPVSDEDLERINNGTGVASFLEGGLAVVEGVEDWSEILEVGTSLTVEGELCT